MSIPATADPQPIAYDIATASRVSSIGKSRLYELIAENKLASTKVGKRRLILADSLKKLIVEGC